jgi:hypothetical protein
MEAEMLCTMSLRANIWTDGGLVGFSFSGDAGVCLDVPCDDIQLGLFMSIVAGLANGSVALHRWTEGKYMSGMPEVCARLSWVSFS